MAAQLIAAHSAAMECYRRAMIGEQSFEGRRENLTQANKLSRTYCVQDGEKALGFSWRRGASAIIRLREVQIKWRLSK
jgi:hypothetical protein